METNLIIRITDFIALALEIIGVAVIGVSFIYAGVRALRQFKERNPNTYDNLKIFIGKALQLGLEFLVAADVIRTVTVEPTMEKILSLGLLIVVRTFLSWSIVVEIEGCWPWQVAKIRRD